MGFHAQTLTRRSFVGASCAAGLAAAGALASMASAPAAHAADGAQTFSDGTLLYSVLDAEARTAAVGSGAQPGVGEPGDGLLDPQATQVVVPASVEHEGASYTVVQIAPYAFQYCALRSVELPDGLVKIAKGAFQFCGALEAVDVPASVTLVSGLAFFACGSLREVRFAPDAQLTEIGDGAFAVLKTSGSTENPDPRSSLEAIELPARLNLLGSYAFYGQYALQSVTFLGQTINEISPYTFGKCTSLTRIDIPTVTSTIERVGRFAFEDDVNLQTVTFQGGMSGTQTTQAGNEFAGCTGIRTVVYRQKKWNATNNGMNPPALGSTFGSGATGNVVAGSGRTAEVIGASFSFGTGGFTDSPDAREYYTVRQYASEADALDADAQPLGWAAIPAGTPLHQVCAGTCEALEQEGFRAGAWAFESGYRASDYLADSLYAFPCEASTLDNAGLLVDAPQDDDGTPALTLDVAARGVPVTVWDAAGNELAEGRDYDLTCTDALGAQADPHAVDAAGSFTVTAVGIGAYEGETSGDLVVGDAPSRWFRLAGSGWQAVGKLATEAGFANASTAETPCDWAFVAPGGVEHAEVALSASALAGAFGAPVLLTDSQTPSDDVAYQINRVGAHTVVVVGDEGCVSLDFEYAIGDLYVVDKVYRIAGVDDLDTCARIASLGPSLGMYWSDTCIVAEKGDLAAALAAAPLAYWYVAPIVWTDRDELGESQVAALGSAYMGRAILVGAGDAGAPQVDAQLEAAGITVASRIEAASAQEEAAAIARHAIQMGMGVSGAVVCAEQEAPQDVAAAVLAGHAGSVLLYAGDEAVAVIEEHRGEVEKGYAVGMPEMLPGDAVAALEAANR